MHKTLALIASAALMGLTLAAHADTIFTLNGTTIQGGTFTGSVLINTVGGVVDGGSVTVTDPNYPGSNTNPLSFLSATPNGPLTNVRFIDQGNDNFYFTLSGSLVGYTGGPICTNCAGNSYYSARNGSGTDALVSGTLSLPGAAVAATPERSHPPSSSSAPACSASSEQPAAASSRPNQITSRCTPTQPAFQTR